jgi:hypothetical protein
MIATTFLVLRQNFLIYLFLLVLYLVMHWLIRYGYLSQWIQLLEFIPNMLLAFLVHRSILFHEPFAVRALSKGSALLKAMEFGTKAIGLSLLTFAAMALAASIIFFAAIPLGTLAVFLLLFIYAAFPVFLAFLGTWLPASVYGQATSFGEAARRGKATFYPLVFKLMVPTSLNLVVSSLVEEKLHFLHRIIAVLVDYGLYDPLDSAAAAIQYTALMISITMVAAALSLTYAKAEGLELSSESTARIS